MTTLPAISDKGMVNALLKAFTSATGDPEWINLHDLKFRLLNARIAMSEEDITRWMAHLVKVGKVTRKDNRTINPSWCLIVEDQPGTLTKEEMRPVKPVFDPPKRDRRVADALPTVAQEDRQIPREPPVWFLKFRQDKESEVAALKRRVNELEMAIMHHATEQTRALSIYGSPNALVELTEQVAMSPKFADLTPQEHKYVASVGLASGLNPEFHLHAWKQSKRVKVGDQWKTVQILSILPDYKALMAAAPDPIMVDERRLSVDEMRERKIAEQDITDGAIAYEVTGYNLKHATMAKAAGLPYYPFKGFGWWAALKPEEKWDDSKRKMVPTGKFVANDTPHGRDGEWVAKKRAMRDLFNQIADLRLKFVQIDGAVQVEDEWQFQGDPEAIDGEFSERQDAQEAPLTEVETTPESDTTPQVIDQETGEVLDAPPITDDPATVIEDAPKCLNCGIDDATGKDPYPKLCGTCAGKVLDNLAKQQEKKAKKS